MFISKIIVHSYSVSMIRDFLPNKDLDMMSADFVRGKLPFLDGFIKVQVFFDFQQNSS